VIIASNPKRYFWTSTLLPSLYYYWYGQQICKNIVSDYNLHTQSIQRPNTSQCETKRKRQRCGLLQTVCGWLFLVFPLPLRPPAPIADPIRLAQRLERSRESILSSVVEFPSIWGAGLSWLYRATNRWRGNNGGGVSHVLRLLSGSYTFSYGHSQKLY